MQAMLLHNFISHALLIALMLVATFIDFDEKTIPDEITIPGTLLGLVLAALWPDAHLPVVRALGAPQVAGYAPLLFTSTSDWPAWLDGDRGLALGLAVYWGWFVALLPATITLRRGLVKAVQFYFASVVRHSTWWKMLVLAVLGATLVTVVWRGGSGERWQALLSSLVGLAFGGGLVWAVRIAGRIALHKEAMGFGDVTLMAMIGAFLGWQPCLMIFFLSPFAAVVIAVTQFILTGRRDIPYGPYLCASALVVILYWPWFWQNFGPAFHMGWLLPAIIAMCLVLMMAMLTMWRMIEQWLWGTGSDR
jgi:prepilin signal peptidase PulO-like enzyme (type II secretory pathway)